MYILHVISYQKERERRLRLKEEHCLMLNLVVEKGASKDHDQSRLSITWPGLSNEVCAKIWIGLWLVKISKYIIHVFFSFSSIVVALTSSMHASLALAITTHQSIVIPIHPSHFTFISSPF